MHIIIFLVLMLFSRINVSQNEQVNVDLNLIKVWGPGLQPDIFRLPARYFFINVYNKNNESVVLPSDTKFDATVEGLNANGRRCRIWTNILDRKDGSYIVRYKLYENCDNMTINIKYKEQHIGKSPYLSNNIYCEDCYCPTETADDFLSSWQCGAVPQQIVTDLRMFEEINWDNVRNKVIQYYDNPGAVSICHYVIKNNEIYNKCYGKHVGFKMFVDSMLISLSKKVLLPDIEFFANLGDYPLVQNEIFPIFSWCGSKDSFDIVMPTYDISESTLENMGKVMLDILSVQGNVNNVWEERIPKAFWRGRDSNRSRLKLIKISRENPDLFNASLTNFFFHRDVQDVYGPKTDHVSFFSFFDYKYQINIDGTVAAYRLPYLLAGGSAVFKQDSQYYEHFYHKLEPYVHYIPVDHDLSDLVSKLKWAIENDNQVREITRNGQEFANTNLLPVNIFCYHVFLLNEFSKKIVSNVNVLEGMEKVSLPNETFSCNKKMETNKDEL